MNRKAQSALEYLMTYGWALIVIAIVIGILWYVTSNATGGVQCSAKSQNFKVNAASVSTNSAQISVTNGTGYQLTSLVFTPSGSFAGATPALPPVAVDPSGTFTITISGYTIPAGESFNDGLLDVNMDYSTLTNVPLQIICSGKV
jgi:hypothetical protein